MTERPVNPFALLSPRLLDGLLQQPLYLVRQHFPRGASSPQEAPSLPLLFTYYLQNETDGERAQRHMRLLLHDKYRFLYNSRHPEHRERLYKAACQPAGFRIYTNLLAKPWKPGPTLKLKINQYVQQKLMWWDFRSSDSLKVTLKDRYGELFLFLLWKHQQTEVNLKEIENFRPCATI